ncbi:MAG: 1-deoxy-D-xylulose-5-phosphate reductoisomerase [Candidatus Omnitrophica bacterium]|nr:1-deoxy-D-xylulose-5-phosphate reductoisomerase [Candidatus Omnitrophota bacterium]
MKQIAVLGSTGSVGLNALRIVRTHPDQFRVAALAVRKSAEELYKQALEFKPELVCLYESEKVEWLRAKLKPHGIRVTTGDEGLVAVSTLKSLDVVLFAVVGAVGLKPIFAAVRAGKSVAVANKEPLVMAGGLLMKEAQRFKASVFPVDSEHSALWQCLQGHASESVKKLILTSSGGPFRKRTAGFSTITPREALKHPCWKMGPKITIDSATMMNKGLEIIEAVNLFNMPAEKIDVLIHPESIIHSMVEFVDGSHLAHLGITDMRLPIQYALSYPDRLVNHLPTLDLARLSRLNFEKSNPRRFPCLELGYSASRAGGTMPAVLNAANEIAVSSFLGHEIRFTDIPRVIEKTMSKHRTVKNPGLDAVLDADQWARECSVDVITAGL